MFEDTPANLVPAVELGFETILIGAKAEPTAENQTRLDTLGLKPTLVASNINTALKAFLRVSRPLHSRAPLLKNKRTKIALAGGDFL